MGNYEKIQIQHLLKLNSRNLIIASNTLSIQIQHLLKLNCDYRRNRQNHYQIQIQHLLKLNLSKTTFIYLLDLDSNTTFVKVKC